MARGDTTFKMPAATSCDDTAGASALSPRYYDEQHEHLEQHMEREVVLEGPRARSAMKLP